MSARSTLVALLLLALPACKDAGVERLKDAKAKYAALVDAGKTPQQKEFDALLDELKSVPAGSKAHAEAQQLIAGIERARASRVAPPLANAKTDLPAVDPSLAGLRAQLVATREECAQLAASVGTLEGAARKAKFELIDACRRRAQELDEQLAHGEPADGGAP